MKLKSFLKKFFLGGDLVFSIRSPFNGEIFVYEDLFGQKRMQVGRVSQSGGLVFNIWQKAREEVIKLKPNKEINSCLILGLGAGNAAELISSKWPKAEIVGIELDPQVVEIGKKYFKLSRLNNLKILVGDGIKIIKEDNLKNKFDLILVDLYLGQEFPKEAEEKDFLSKIKNMLTKDGLVVFNRFYWAEYQSQAKDFQKRLFEIFPKVWSKKTYSNVLLFASLS